MLSGQGLSSLIVLMWHCGERSERGSDGHRARMAASDRLRTLFLRHPGLDPGSIAALKSWTPDQVRGDERAERTSASTAKPPSPSRKKKRAVARSLSPPLPPAPPGSKGWRRSCSGPDRV